MTVTVALPPGYLTWEWRHGVSSSVYPLVIAAFFKVAQVRAPAAPAYVDVDTSQLPTLEPHSFQPRDLTEELAVSPVLSCR